MGYYLEIIYKDGSSMTLRLPANETEKVLSQFKNGEPKIEIETLGGSVGNTTIISASAIKALRPYFVKEEETFRNSPHHIWADDEENRRPPGNYDET